MIAKQKTIDDQMNKEQGMSNKLLTPDEKTLSKMCKIVNACNYICQGILY